MTVSPRPLPSAPTACGNRVDANNLACPGAANGGPPPLSGYGIVLGGTSQAVVDGNRVTGNALSGPAAFPTAGVVVIDTTSLGGAAPTDNRVTDNRLRANVPVDLFYDGSGSGNVFHENRCQTSTPAGLCT